MQHSMISCLEQELMLTNPITHKSLSTAMHCHGRPSTAATVSLLMQARSVAEGILATVALMEDSRLPCFSRGAPLPNLRKRFHLDMTEAKAAAFMRSTILDAYDKVIAVCACPWNAGSCAYLVSNCISVKGSLSHLLLMLLQYAPWCAWLSQV